MNANKLTTGYSHPKTILEFESVYRNEYEQALDSCDGWLKWCENQNPKDTHGVNFHQGMRSAHVFNNIKMEQLLRVLKQQEPNKLSVVPKPPLLPRLKMGKTPRWCE